MTDEERRAAEAISSWRVTYPVASFQKRFARSMGTIAAQPADQAQLTDKQRLLLWKQVIRFRRQIPDVKLVLLARRRVKELERPQPDQETATP